MFLSATAQLYSPGLQRCLSAATKLQPPTAKAVGIVTEHFTLEQPLHQQRGAWPKRKIVCQSKTLLSLYQQPTLAGARLLVGYHIIMLPPGGAKTLTEDALQHIRNVYSLLQAPATTPLAT